MEVVCGRDLEANRRQADLDERQRGEFFDVLVQQADEARTRVREGSRWQGIPLLGASSFVATTNPSSRQHSPSSRQRKLLLLAKRRPASATERGGVPLLVEEDIGLLLSQRLDGEEGGQPPAE